MSFSNRSASLKRATQKVDARRANNETRKSATMLALMTPGVVIRPVLASANQPTFRPLRAIPKEPRERNATLLDMARGKPCLLRSPICVPDPLTTVACHGAGVANGKGLGYKLSDFWTVQGCAQCNHYTDAYKDATADEKKAVFDRGHVRQIEVWREVIKSPCATEKERKAAVWAVDRWAVAVEKKRSKNV